MASRSTLGTLGVAAASVAAAVGVGAVVGTVVAPARNASGAVAGLTALVRGAADHEQTALQGDDDGSGWAPQAPSLSGGGAVGGGHAQSAGS